MRLGLVILLALAIFAFASSTQTPAFEAASIRPANPDRRGSGISVQAARIKVINATVKFCVEVAWNVKDFQVSGGPAWLDTERYDIDAVAAQPFVRDEYRIMLQAMLAERFAIAVHRDAQERQGYALVVAKNGPKLPPPKDDPSVMFSRTPTGDFTLTAPSVTMTQLASALSSNMSAIVVDRTGLEGKFDVFMQWTPDPSSNRMLTKNGEPLPPPSDATQGPSIFTALQEKLGLKLETRKVPVEIIVVDHAERPTAN
jgi:uncharacterized protein (TIGR03435 family)